MLLSENLIDYPWLFSWAFTLCALAFIFIPYKATYYKKYCGNEVFCFLGSIKIIVPSDPQAHPTVRANGITTYLGREVNSVKMWRSSIDRLHFIRQFWTAVTNSGDSIHGTTFTGETYSETVGYWLNFELSIWAAGEWKLEKIKLKANLKQASRVDNVLETFQQLTRSRRDLK